MHVQGKGRGGAGGTYPMIWYPWGYQITGDMVPGRSNVAKKGFMAQVREASMRVDTEDSWALTELANYACAIADPLTCAIHPKKDKERATNTAIGCLEFVGIGRRYEEFLQQESCTLQNK